jgi:hypothetical protein
MTINEARRLVAVALAAYPSMQEKDMSLTAAVWQKALGDLPLDNLEKAIIKIIVSKKFFPSISEIRSEAVSFAAPVHPQPEEAWAEVMAQLDPYRTPHYSDPLIQRAVKAVGYLNLCMSERIGVERAHFLQIYGAFLQTDTNRRQNEAVMEITAANAPELLRLLAGIGRPL